LEPSVDGDIAELGPVFQSSVRLKLNCFDSGPTNGEISHGFNP
jgi:hypothetical protein